MNPKQKKRILSAIEHASLAVNKVSFEESMLDAHRIFTRMAECIEDIKTQEQLAETLTAIPDLSPREEFMVKAAFKFAPQLLRLGLKSLAIHAEAELPGPSGGRQPALTHEEERRICSGIGNLIAQKVSVEDSQRRAAQKFGISLRTVARVWSRRDKIMEGTEEPTFTDALSAVKGLLG